MRRTAALLVVTIAATFLSAPMAQAAPGDYVRPIDWSQLGSYTATDPAGQRMAAILAKSSKYLLGPWYAPTYQAYAPDGYLNLGGTDEKAVRLPGMAAVSVAVAMKMGVYDQSIVAYPGALVREMNLTRTIAARHKANNTDTATAWGSGWQTTLWAYYGGLAAWLMWGDLSTVDRDKVVKMMVWESARLISGNDVYLVGTSGNQLYMKRRDGSLVTPGDSKAEEDNWNAALLGLAAAMMPTHPDQPAWRNRNHQLLLAAAARPADLTGSQVIHGVQLSTWLKGTNIADDGTLQNHSILHPLYMAAFDQSLLQATISGMARTCAPSEGLHNVAIVYSALVSKQFPVAGGGTRTIYQPGSADIYYPEGNDWGTEFPFYFGYFDLLVSLHGLSTSAATFEQLHNDRQLALMARFTDGRTYGAASENTYYGREHRIGSMAGQGYLSLFLARNVTGNRICWF